MRLQRLRRVLLFFAFLLFPITFMYFSPALTVLGASRAVVASGLLMWSLVLLTSLVLNRSFCGWACPLAGIQEAVHAGTGRSLTQPRRGRAIKYALWAAWVGGILFVASRAAGPWGIDIFFQNPGFPPYERGAHIAWLGFALLAAVPPLFLGRRAFCHYLCFFSPLNILGSRLLHRLHLPGLRVRVVKPEACTQCQRCSRECPMSLEVSAMVAQGAIDNRECITCGACSAACRVGVLSYGFITDRTDGTHGTNGRTDPPEVAREEQEPGEALSGV